jgi:hypothetical protein
VTNDLVRKDGMRNDPMTIPCVATAYGYVIAELSKQLHPAFAQMVLQGAAREMEALKAAHQRTGGDPALMMVEALKGDVQ